MPGFDGTGPQGRGPLTGRGRGYCNPWGIRTGLQRNFPRRMTSYIYPYERTHGFGRFDPPSSREEIGFIKNEAQLLNDELKVLKARIWELEARN